MITKKVIMTLKENTVKLSSKLFMYRGDGNIKFEISIKGLDYKFDSEVYVCSCIIQKPDKTFLSYDNMEVSADGVYLTFDPSMVNDLSEVGEYTVQLALHSTVLKNDRVTLPAFNISVYKGLGD